MSYYFPIFGELVLGSDPGDNVVSDSYAITGPSTFGTTYAAETFPREPEVVSASTCLPVMFMFHLATFPALICLPRMSWMADVRDAAGVSPGTYTWSLPNDQDHPQHRCPGAPRDHLVRRAGRGVALSHPPAAGPWRGAHLTGVPAARSPVDERHMLIRRESVLTPDPGSIFQCRLTANPA